MGEGKEGRWKKRPWDEDTHEKAGNLSLSRRHHTGVKLVLFLSLSPSSVPVKFTMHGLFVRRVRCAPVKNRAQISVFHVKSGQVVCSLKVSDLTQFADCEWL